MCTHTNFCALEGTASYKRFFGVRQILSFFFQVKGAIHVFTKECLQSENFSFNKPLFRIASERVAAFFPSPERPRREGQDEDGKGSTPPSPARGPFCAIFSKEVKGAPALFEIYELSEQALCVAKKSFFQAQQAECEWAYDGRAVLIKTHTDASDQTYYGSSALYFLRVCHNLI